MDDSEHTHRTSVGSVPLPLPSIRLHTLNSTNNHGSFFFLEYVGKELKEEGREFEAQGLTLLVVLAPRRAPCVTMAGVGSVR